MGTANDVSNAILNSDYLIKNSNETSLSQNEKTLLEADRKSLKPTSDVPNEPPASSQKVETVFKNLTIDADKSECPPQILHTDENGAPVVDINIKSDVSRNKFESKRSSTACIYSVNGSPSRRVIRKRDFNSTVFPVGCMGCKDTSVLDLQQTSKEFSEDTEIIRRRPYSALPSRGSRNPVTGAGIEALEVRRSSCKRKDGNPLLGTGYEEAPTIPSSSRVPPGGYSQGLW